MRKLILTITLLLLPILVSAAKVVPIKGPFRPYQIRVDESRAYIVEGAAIYIYSLKDFSLQKKFGKKGEGPQEFIIPPPGGVEIVIGPDCLLVNSLGKLSYFTKQGEFKKEIKITTIQGGGVLPIGDGDRFVAISTRQQNNTIYDAVDMFDADLKRVKEVFRVKSSLQPGKVDIITTARRPLLCTFADKIFFGGPQGEIHVFDGSGKKRFTISHKYEKIKLSEEHKKRYILFFKTDPRFKQGWEQFKDQLHFPAFLPVIRNLIVSDEKIYILTYKNKDKKREFHILDLEGKPIKKAMLPLPEMNPLELYPYTIKNNKLYQLIENENLEEWELHITEIE
ncbi:MAG: hypothetical protein JSV88_13540 [Candidatus Aminicenantes bacterium]|nr:MAG: hypothetical protein JSV88_13540 [Candidatus Aminicenantes bacterium]